MKRLLLALALLLAALPARAGEPFTAQQEEALGRIVRDYLMKHPEAIIEALQNAEEQMKAAAAEKGKRAIADRKADLERDPASPVWGNADGDVTLVEFFDYRCPYCKQVVPSVKALLAEDKQLRIVLKEFPVLGKESVAASRAALAAQRQGKYDAFHEALMSHRGQLTEDAVMRIAGSVGLDAEKLAADMSRPEIEAQLRKNYELAQALEIRGTPAFIIGGELIPGAVDVGTLRRKIAEARKPG